MHWNISLPSFRTNRRNRGYLSSVPLLHSDAEKEDNVVGTSENSISDHIFEASANLEAPGRVRGLVATITCILATLVIAIQIAGLILVWSGKIHITFHTGSRLPPRMELETPIEFIEYEEYSGWAQDHGMPAWKKQTANLEVGRVFVENPQKYGLVLPDLNSDKEGYTMYPVALYHQLHCLGTIREVFYTLNISEEIAYGGHLGHCFDYLRQSLWCAGDLTLEYTAVGWDVEHLCKDPQEIASFMESFDRRR